MIYALLFLIITFQIDLKMEPINIFIKWTEAMQIKVIWKEQNNQESAQNILQNLY